MALPVRFGQGVLLFIKESNSQFKGTLCSLKQVKLRSSLALLKSIDLRLQNVDVLYVIHCRIWRIVAAFGFHLFRSAEFLV